MPHDAPDAHSDNSVPSEFGPLLAERRRGIGDRILYSVVALAFGFVGILALYGAVFGLNEPKDPTPLSARLMLGAIGTAMAALPIACWITLTETLAFHERGLVQHRARRVRSAIPYHAATHFVCATTRHYMNGVYAGTALSLRLQAPGYKKIRYSGRHKERAAGLGLFSLLTTFKGEDEVDTLKIIIARAMVQSLIEREPSFSFRWASSAVLTREGLVPRTGRRKNQLVPYEQIVGFATKDGFLSLTAAGDRKPFLKISINADNFYPGWELLSLMRADPAAAETPSQAA